MKKLALTLLGLHLALVPCWADVIPTTVEDRDASAQKAVQQRLESLGLGAVAAEQRARQLSGEELAYFGEDPARLQPAAGLYWYEWLFGAVVIGGVTAIAIVLNNDYKDQLD